MNVLLIESFKLRGEVWLASKESLKISTSLFCFLFVCLNVLVLLRVLCSMISTFDYN